jgi:hypothetical protein
MARRARRLVCEGRRWSRPRKGGTSWRSRTRSLVIVREPRANAPMPSPHAAIVVRAASAGGFATAGEAATARTRSNQGRPRRGRHGQRVVPPLRYFELGAFVMARLALSVWVALTVLTLIACVDDRSATRWAELPKLPVPAGDSLADVRLNPGKRLVYDQRVVRTPGSSCTNCRRTAKARAVWRARLPRRRCAQRIGGELHKGCRPALHVATDPSGLPARRDRIGVSGPRRAQTYRLLGPPPDLTGPQRNS